MPPFRTRHGFFDRSSSVSSQPTSIHSENGDQVPAVTSESTSNQTRRSITSSWIRNHGTRLEAPEGKRWSYHYCTTTLSAGITSTTSSHLKKHGFTEIDRFPSNQIILKEFKPIIGSTILRKLIIE